MSIYTVSVKRHFTAYHYLVGGDWGPENERHAHHYDVELELWGKELDHHGYLVDIVDIDQAFDALVKAYEEKTLNSLDEFKEMNPSIENFSRIICQRFASDLDASNITAIKVKIWENEIACASFRQEL